MKSLRRVVFALVTIAVGCSVEDTSTDTSTQIASSSTASTTGSGGASATATVSSSATAGGSAMAAFELNGEWSYTGGEIAVGGLTETLVIDDKSMLDQGDYKGTSWTISYKVDSYDNDGDRAQLTVASVEGFSHYAVGEELYMS